MLWYLPVVALINLLATPAYSAVLPGNGKFVNLRIEGISRTIFDGVVFITGHNVTTASGKTHHCDGTNNGANPRPGPTATSALNDGARTHHFTWDGTFTPSFDDFLITSIAGESQTETQFWGILLDFKLIPVGGCQQQVKTFDQVLFAFDAFSKVRALKLSGPSLAKVGKAVKLTVKNGSSGAPVAGAIVDGKTTDANGEVSVVFSKAGLNKFKAEKDDSIRSNSITVAVVP